MLNTVEYQQRPAVAITTLVKGTPLTMQVLGELQVTFTTVSVNQLNYAVLNSSPLLL